MFKSLAKKLKPKTRKHLRKWVSSSLRFLPQKTGDKVIIFLNGLVNETMGRRRAIQQTASREASKLASSAKIHGLTGLVIFDLDVSPTTIGDFIYAIVIGRWMINHGLDTKVVITGYRADRSESIEPLVSEYRRIARNLLKGGEFLTTKESGHQVAKQFSRDPAAQNHVLFDSKVLEGESIYQYFFYLANVLYARQQSANSRESFLFSRVEFPTPKHRPSGEYVVCHARFNENYGADRNTTKEELLRVIYGIRGALGKVTIVIATDRLSDEYYSPVVRRFPGKVFLSSHFSDSFLGDCGLIMSASSYFAYNGGGISAIPMFSKLPWIICARTRNEIHWKKNKLTSWQLDHQHFLSSDKHSLLSFDWGLLNRYLAPKRFTKSAEYYDSQTK